jgi:hypothetical protein
LQLSPIYGALGCIAKHTWKGWVKVEDLSPELREKLKKFHQRCEEIYSEMDNAGVNTNHLSAYLNTKSEIPLTAEAGAPPGQFQPWEATRAVITELETTQNLPRWIPPIMVGRFDSCREYHI